MLIDDFSRPALVSELGTTWRQISDTVMGGVSEGQLSHRVVDGRHCLRMTGTVHLENNGGFIQASLDLAEDDGLLDATGFKGIRIIARGNKEQYSVHLRTTDTTEPWQSYRSQFFADEAWHTIKLPFADFSPHRLQKPLDTGRLRRIGVVAIGREFSADVSISELAFYR